MSEPSPAVELTRSLVGFDTINPPGNEDACARFLGERLQAAGFEVSYHAFAEGRTSLVARRGDRTGRAPLAFTGHLDTVPLGARAWSVDPFGGEIADGRIHGRGTTDMKAGVAAFVTAAVDAAEALDDGPGTVLLITASEETGSQGARHLAGLGEEVGRIGALVVAEPTANAPLVGHKGALWLTARTEGVTAHGSMPERGENAITKAARVVDRLADFDFNVAPHEVLGRPTLNVGTIAGGMNINSVPDRTDIGVDIRTIPGMQHDRLREGLTGYLAPELATLEAEVDLEGVWTEPQDPWIRQVYDVMTPLLGAAPRPGGASYFTDASVLTPAFGGVPTVILGPGEPGMAHQTDEYCEVARIDQAVTAYGELLRRWQSAS